MLKEIIKAFMHKDVVPDLASRVGEMLDAGRWMFYQAYTVLAHRAASEDVSDQLYQRDRQINHIEQQIRERIVTHLSLGNQADLGPCLILMSVVKDAERIGDYCKNIFEVGKFFQGEFRHPSFSEPLEEIRREVDDLFEPTKQAFLTGDEKLAESVLRQASSAVKRCDLLIRQLLSAEGTLRADEAVAYVLLARHYKRVEAHLSNIATSVISPISLLDYRV